MLIIEGEPCDVNLTRALEDPRRNVQHTSISVSHNVRLESAIEPLVSTEKDHDDLFIRSLVKWGEKNE